MKLTITVDCTPTEARTFLGMPDVEPMNDMIVEEMSKRVKDNLDTLADPERLIASWVNMGGKGLEQVQKMMAGALSGTTGGSKKK